MNKKCDRCGKPATIVLNYDEEGIIDLPWHLCAEHAHIIPDGRLQLPGWRCLDNIKLENGNGNK
jgi:hypothetical protein